MGAISACDLFQRCVDGRGGEEWREFVRRFGRRIRSSVRRAFRRAGIRLVKSDLEEFVQDLYCGLLVAGSRRFRGHSEEQLWTYLGRVARSVAVDHQRALRARKRRPVRVDSEVDPWWSEEVATKEATPEERFLFKERLWTLLERCREVARGDRIATGRAARVLRMAILEGWSSREISHRLDGALSPNQIDRLIHRLKTRLAAEGIRLPRRRGGHRPAGWRHVLSASALRQRYEV